MTSPDLEAIVSEMTDRGQKVIVALSEKWQRPPPHFSRQAVAGLASRHSALCQAGWPKGRDRPVEYRLTWLGLRVREHLGVPLPDVAAIAAKLSEEFRAIICEMDGRPSWGEGWFAVRRELPELVDAVQTRAQCMSYHLSPLGLQVRAYLQKEQGK